MTTWGGGRDHTGTRSGSVLLFGGAVCSGSWVTGNRPGRFLVAVAMGARVASGAPGALGGYGLDGE